MPDSNIVTIVTKDFVTYAAVIPATLLEFIDTRDLIGRDRLTRSNLSTIGRRRATDFSGSACVTEVAGARTTGRTNDLRACRATFVARACGYPQLDAMTGLWIM